MAIEIINSQQSGLLTKDQMSQNPSSDGGEDLLVPLLTENLLAVGSFWGRGKKSFFSKDVVICRLLVLQWMAPHSSTYGWVALTRFNTLAKKRKIKGAHVEKIWKGIGRILEQNNVIYFIIYLFGIIKIKKKYRVSLVLMA